MHIRSIILRLLMAVGLVAAGLMLAPAANATGGDDPVPCVPKDAWTETIEHPAITHLEHHEAVTHPEYRYTRTVDETVTQWRFVKYTHTKTRPTNGDWSAYGPWEMWQPVGHESWEATDVEALGSPARHGSGTTNGTEWYREWQPRNTGETRQVPGGSRTETTDWLAGPPAGEGWTQIDERVVTDHAAYDETVVDKEAWTETVEHPAVVCEEEPPAYDEREVCVLWSVDDPEVGDFPQTRVDTDDCTVPPATCEGDQRFQKDYYWIRDAEDEAYLAGLEHLTSPADDASLEPHNWSMIDVPATSGQDCTPPPVCEPDHNGDEPGCGEPPVDVCVDIPGDQAEVPPGHVGDDETGECVLIPEEPVLPPTTPEKPTKPAKPHAGPPTIQLTQAPAQPAPPSEQAEQVLPATGAPASLWLGLLGAGLVLGGVALTRRSNA